MKSHALRPAPTRLELIGVVVTLIGAYVVAGKLGLMLAIVHPSTTAVWPPAGIALAALLILGYRFWPCVLLGAFLVNVTTTGTVATSFGIALGNTLEGLLGAYLVNTYANGVRFPEHPKEIFQFGGLAVVVSTAVGATIGATTLVLGHVAQWADYGSIWLTWWLGDAMGDLIFAPALVLWGTSPRLRWNGRKFVEAISLFLMLFLIGHTAFGGLLPTEVQNYPLAFLCVPILVWAAYRFGSRETATAIAVLSLIALLSPLRGVGPFVRNTPNESLLFVQICMGIMAMLGLAFAAVLEERKQAEAVHARLAAIVDSSHDAIIGKSLDGIAFSWNATAERMFGYSSEEVLGRSIAFLIPESRLEEEATIIARLRRGERINQFETVRQRKDGQTIDVSLTISLIKDPTGRVVGISKIVRDITQRKQAQLERENLIRELEEALDRVKVLSGLLPICASCKKVRDDGGYWKQIEAYISEHSEATFTHSVCPGCFAQLYPGFKHPTAETKTLT